MKLYAIRDIKAESFADPFHLQNDAVAMRAVSAAANDPTTLLYKHPEDYQLWYLGEFDTDSGTIFGAGGFLANVSQFKE